MIMMIMMANTTTMRHKKSDTCAQRQQERKGSEKERVPKGSPVSPTVQHLIVTSVKIVGVSSVS